MLHSHIRTDSISPIIVCLCLHDAPRNSPLLSFRPRDQTLFCSGSTTGVCMCAGRIILLLLHLLFISIIILLLITLYCCVLFQVLLMYTLGRRLFMLLCDSELASELKGKTLRGGARRNYWVMWFLTTCP